MVCMRKRVAESGEGGEVRGRKEKERGRGRNTDRSSARSVSSGVYKLSAVGGPHRQRRHGATEQLPPAMEVCTVGRNTWLVRCMWLGMLARMRQGTRSPAVERH
eukprot:scaffold255286_cov40-Tisochrysis_lutea.AAC.1